MRRSYALYRWLRIFEPSSFILKTRIKQRSPSVKIEILRELELLKEQHGSPARGRGRRYPDVFKQKMAELMKRGMQFGEFSRATAISVASYSLGNKTFR